jgi:hypothetical protein
MIRGCQLLGEKISDKIFYLLGIAGITAKLANTLTVSVDVPLGYAVIFFVEPSSYVGGSVDCQAEFCFVHSFFPCVIVFRMSLLYYIGGECQLALEENRKDFQNKKSCQKSGGTRFAVVWRHDKMSGAPARLPKWQSIAILEKKQKKTGGL